MVINGFSNTLAYLMTLNEHTTNRHNVDIPETVPKKQVWKNSYTLSTYARSADRLSLPLYVHRYLIYVENCCHRYIEIQSWFINKRLEMRQADKKTQNKQWELVFFFLFFFGFCFFFNFSFPFLTSKYRVDL